MLDPVLAEKLKAWARGQADILLFFVHGSRVSGFFHEGSDLDIACAFSGQSLVRESSVIVELEALLGIPVDLLDLSRAGGLILGEVLRTGELIRMADVELLCHYWWEVQEFDEWIKPSVRWGREEFLKTRYLYDLS